MAVQGSFVRFAMVLCALSSLADLRAGGRIILKELAQSIQGYEVPEEAWNQPVYASQLLLRSKRQSGQEPLKLPNPFLEAAGSSGSNNGELGGISSALEGQQADVQQRASTDPFLEGSSQKQETTEMSSMQNTNQDKVPLQMPLEQKQETVVGQQLEDGRGQLNVLSNEQTKITEGSEHTVGQRQESALLEKADGGGDQKNVAEQGSSQVRETESSNGPREVGQRGSFSDGTISELSNLEQASQGGSISGQLQIGDGTQSKVSTQEFSGGSQAGSVNRELPNAGEKNNIAEGGSSQVKFTEFPSDLRELAERGSLGAGRVSDVSNLGVASRSGSTTGQMRIRATTQSKLSMQQLSSEIGTGSVNHNLLNGGGKKNIAEGESGQIKLTEYPSGQGELGQTGSLGASTVSDPSNLGQVSQSSSATRQQQITESTQSNVSMQQLSGGSQAGSVNPNVLNGGENKNMAEGGSSQVKLTEYPSSLNEQGQRGSFSAGTMSEVSNLGQTSQSGSVTGQRQISERTQSKVSMQQFSGGSGAGSVSRNLLNAGENKNIAGGTSQLKLTEYPSGLGEPVQTGSSGAGAVSEISYMGPGSQSGIGTRQQQITESTQSKVSIQQYSSGNQAGSVNRDLLNSGGNKNIAEGGSSQVKLTDYPSGQGDPGQRGSFSAGTVSEVSNLGQAIQGASLSGQLRIGERTQSKISIQPFSRGSQAESVNLNLLNRAENKNIAEGGTSQVKLTEYPSGLGELSQRGSFGAGTINEVSNLGQASQGGISSGQLRIGESTPSKVSIQQFSRSEAGSFDRDIMNRGIAQRPALSTSLLKRTQGLANQAGRAIGQLRIGGSMQSKISLKKLSGGSEASTFGGDFMGGATTTRTRPSGGTQRGLQDITAQFQAGSNSERISGLLNHEAQGRRSSSGNFIGDESLTVGGLIPKDSSQGVTTIRKVVQVTTNQKRENSFMGLPSRRVIVQVKTMRKTYSDHTPQDTTQGRNRLRLLVHTKPLAQNVGSGSLLSGVANRVRSVLLPGTSSSSGSSGVILTQQGATQGGGLKQGGRWWKVKVYRYRVQKGGKTISGHKTVTTVHSKPTVIRKQWSWTTRGSTSGIPDILTGLGGLTSSRAFTSSLGGSSHAQMFIHHGPITSTIHGGDVELPGSVGVAGGVAGSSGQQLSQRIIIRHTKTLI